MRERNERNVGALTVGAPYESVLFVPLSTSLQPNTVNAPFLTSTIPYQLARMLAQRNYMFFEGVKFAARLAGGTSRTIDDACAQCCVIVYLRGFC